MKCQIQWINDAGTPTPDDNEAVAIAVREAHAAEVEGRFIEMDEQRIPICIEHMNRLPMPYWHVEPLYPLTRVPLNLSKKGKVT